MKKKWILFAMVFCLLLSSCGQSAAAQAEEAAREAAELQAAEEAAAAAAAEQEAAAAEEARIAELQAQAADISSDIAALTLGPDMGPALEEIEGAYDALTEEGRGYVEDYDTLLELKDAYEQKMETVQEAVDAIDAIGEIDENSMEDIEYAQACYDEVDPEFLSAVTNASVLDGAEDACRQAIRDKGARETQALIDAGQYQEAMDYAGQYIMDHPEMGSQTELATLQQTAELYLAWQYYNTNYLEDTQDILDHLTGDAITDDLYAGAWYLQDRLNTWLTSSEPSNGKILSKSISGGYGELTINSGSNPMLIKVERTDDASKYIYFYVRGDSSAKINVPDGDYLVKYASGSVYYGSGADYPFGRNTSFSQADDVMEFSTTYSGNYIYYSTITLTLYAVAGGNMSSYSIDPDNF